MTKKSGLFEVDIDLALLKLESEISVEPKKEASKKIDEAVEIVIKQMESSGYRPRTIIDYETIVGNFKKAQAIEYLSEITLGTIYNWLDQMQVCNQTKQTRLKALKSFLSKCFNNGWYNTKFWQTVNVKVDKNVKSGANESDVKLLLSLLDVNTFVGLRDAVAILTMYKTGIRINTLGQLEEKHKEYGIGRATVYKIVDKGVFSGVKFVVNGCVYAVRLTLYLINFFKVYLSRNILSVKRNN